MPRAQAKRDTVLASMALEAPSVPVISNVTAQPHGSPVEIRQRLVDQITAPVRWEASMRCLVAQGFTQFIELGPGTALRGFMRRIDKKVQILNVADVASLETAARTIA